MKKNIPRCPFAWFGGKGQPKIKKFILERFPEHQNYIEPFGGGGSLLLAKTPAKIEVYNDVNRALTNFFRVIKHEDTFRAFMAKISNLPVSREIFEDSVAIWPRLHDSVEQAVHWYYAQRLSFSGRGDSFAVSQSSSGGVCSTIATLKSSLEILPAVHERMSNTIIECVDWRDALELYNGNDWLAYCDPPYVMGARKSGGYANELSNKDHEEFIDRLMKYKGMVVLSGYPNGIYEPLLEHGWKFETLDVLCTAAGRTRTSGLQGEGNVKEKQQRTECLWMNPLAVANQKKGGH